MVLTSIQTNLSTGMRKGSVFVRGVATKGSHAVLMVCGCSREAYTRIVKYDRVDRKSKGTWCVVLCSPKDYAATEAAHRSRFSYSTMVVHLPVKETAEGSNPSNV